MHAHVSTERSKDRAHEWAQRLHQRELRLRFTFVVVQSGSPTAEPALSKLLQKRDRGCALRLYLALLWMAGSEGGQRGRRSGTRQPEPGRAFKLEPDYRPHTCEVSLDELRDLVGLANTSSNRNINRRLRKALGALEHLELIELESLGDDPAVQLQVQLRREDGSGRDYSDPGKVRDAYIRMDHRFFTNGWLAVLPPHAVAVYLLYRVQSESRGPSDPEWVFANPTRLESLRSFDHSTRKRGEVVGEAYGLLRSRPASSAVARKMFLPLSMNTRQDPFARVAPALPPPDNPSHASMQRHMAQHPEAHPGPPP